MLLKSWGASIPDPKKQMTGISDVIPICPSTAGNVDSSDQRMIVRRVTAHAKLCFIVHGPYSTPFLMTRMELMCGLNLHRR
jgi:hypothetical protein